MYLQGILVKSIDFSKPDIFLDMFRETISTGAVGTFMKILIN